MGVSVYYNDPRSLAAGAPIGSKEYTIAANRLISVSNLVEAIIGSARESLYGDLSGVQVQFDVVSPTGAVVIYTSSVDNGREIRSSAWIECIRARSLQSYGAEWQDARREAVLA